MTFKLGAKSIANLEGVHDDLSTVVRLAIRLTAMDFSVFDGVRTDKEQNAKFRAGASKIDGFQKKGRHQIGADGFGHAVDLVPYFEGVLQWEWGLIFPVADAIKQAADDLRIPIRWGGTWTEITSQRYQGMKAMQIYDTNPSWDGAHYELPSHTYK